MTLKDCRATRRFPPTNVSENGISSVWWRWYSSIQVWNELGSIGQDCKACFIPVRQMWMKRNSYRKSHKGLIPSPTQHRNNQGIGCQWSRGKFQILWEITMWKGSFSSCPLWVMNVNYRKYQLPLKSFPQRRRAEFLLQSFLAFIWLLFRVPQTDHSNSESLS